MATPRVNTRAAEYPGGVHTAVSMGTACEVMLSVRGSRQCAQRGHGGGGVILSSI